jgi:hypothetical protein
MCSQDLRREFHLASFHPGGTSQGRAFCAKNAEIAVILQIHVFSFGFPAV